MPGCTNSTHVHILKDVTADDGLSFFYPSSLHLYYFSPLSLSLPYLFVSLSLCLFARLSLCFSVCPSVCLSSVFLFPCLNLRLSLYVHLSLALCLSISALSLHVSQIFLFVSLTRHLSLFLSFNPSFPFSCPRPYCKITLNPILPLSNNFFLLPPHPPLQ